MIKINETMQVFTLNDGYGTYRYLIHTDCTFKYNIKYPMCFLAGIDGRNRLIPHIITDNTKYSCGLQISKDIINKFKYVTGAA